MYSIDVLETLLSDLLKFLHPYIPLINSHNTDFYVENLWDTLIPRNMQSDLQNYPNILDNFFNSDLPSPASSVQRSDYSERDEWQPFTSPHFEQYDSLEVLLSSIKEHLNMFNTNAQTLETFVAEWDLGIKSSCFVPTFMSQKKEHEVEEMVQLCGLLCGNFHIERVIDVGCGRGYLSHHLYALYNLNVLGIDYSTINIKSLQQRSMTLGKYWNGLIKKFGKTKSVAESTDNADKDEIENKKDIFDQRDENIVNHSKQSLYCAVSDYVNEETNLSKLYDDNMVACVQESEVHHLLCDKDKSEEFFLLTGLHTCGNLSSTMSKLFINNTSAHILCTVPCCYHLLDEIYAPQEYHRNKELIIGNSFPMSSLLKQKKFWIGRNARMLACQAIDRLSKKRAINYLSIHWRAMLQKMLVSHYGASNNDWQVGRIFSKSKSFLDYVQKSVLKLNLDCNFSEEYLCHIENSHDEYIKHIDMFLQLKSLFAPIIEAIILLDNLLFLLEKPCTTNACLLRLFDSVKSPRCHALVARK